MNSPTPTSDPSGLLRHSLYNLLGQMTPVLVAVVAIPFVLSGLGVERFALLSLAWSMLAYASVFDLGIGRATTHLVARETNGDRFGEQGRILFNALFANAIVGILLTALLLPAVDPALRILSIPEPLVPEARRMMEWVMLSIPVLTIAGTLRSALEGRQRFGLVNAVKGPFNGLLFFIPALGVVFSLGLDEIIGWIVVSRVVLLFFYGVPLVRQHPDIFRSRLSRPLLRTLFLYGGWVTVSNTLGPVIAFGERVIIPMMLSVGALSYYTAPYELISRLAVIPFSITLVSFPRISAAFFGGEEGTWSMLVSEPILLLHAVVTPMVAILFAFSSNILSAWLGPEFGAETGRLVKILALAFYANGFAYILLAAVQGMGRPDLKAKLDIIETILFLGLCVGGVAWLGLEGAALAKLAIFVIDAVVLYGFARSIAKRDPGRDGHALGSKTWLLSGIFLSLSALADVAIDSLAVKILVFGVILPSFLALLYRMHRSSPISSWCAHIVTSYVPWPGKRNRG